MSQTFSASRSPASSDDTDQDYRASLDRYHFSSQASDGPVPSLTASASFASRAREQLPIAQPSVASPDQRPLNLLDVSNILNPTPQGSVESSRRTSLAQFGSPRSSVHTAVSRHGAPRSLPPSPVEPSNPADQVLRSTGGGSTFPGRRIAPAVPPSSRIRHTSRPSLSGIISAQDSPFPLATPRRLSGFSTEIHAAPGPPPPTHPPVGGPPSQPSFPFPSVSTPLQYATSFSTPISSANASPNTPYSSYVQSSQSPVPTTPTYAHPGYISGHHGGPPHSGPYAMPGPSGHGAHGYHMMSLNTAEGAIHIPVNTTAASRSADEKRKRNAGASARFRQRRKEREREMSTRISDLEQRLKKVEEERDYYRDLALRSQRAGGQSSLASPRGVGQSESGFGGFRTNELPRPGSGVRDLPGMEDDGRTGGFQGRSGHPEMSGGVDMREASVIRRESERERERERYERERYQGGDQRHR